MARSHFQTTHAARYPTAFSVRPTTRPAYIPKTTLVGGVATPVRWSNSLHRYGVRKNGHMAPYQLWSDRAATSGLMTSAGYFWGPKPKSASGGWGLFIGLAIGGVIFFVLIFIGFLVLRAIRKSLTGGGPKKVTASKRQPILPPPGLRHDEPMHPDYWMQLAIGDFVVIHDFQAFEDALDGPKGVRYGDDFRIKSLIRLRGAAAGSWDGVLAELEQMGLQSLWLLAWRQGGQTQLSVYYAPTGFEPGTRTALLDRDETWPFQEPTSDDWRPGELAYNHEVTHVGTGADGAETEQRFVQLPGGPAAAGSSSEPGAANLQAATVVRWRCADAPHNPLMLLLEQGASADMAGGHLRLWLGTPVDSHEVGVTPVSVRS
ncbi:MAG: hypothetical protein KC502_05085 [Myxococcales bacterium]|nr:hypothetical protein [Myxococcales bacterium]